MFNRYWLKQQYLEKRDFMGFVPSGKPTEGKVFTLNQGVQGSSP